MSDINQLYLFVLIQINTLFKKKKIKSCWGLNSKGFSIIKKEKEWKERLDMLSSNIDYWIINNTDKTVEIIQLFYDI